MHLSDKALLVHLGVSQWTARKLDRKAAAIISTKNVGNFNKTLLPTCNSIGDVHRETADIRKGFYHNVLPWGIEGTFILPSANYLPLPRTTVRRRRRGMIRSRHLSAGIPKPSWMQSAYSTAVSMTCITLLTTPLCLILSASLRWT